MAELTEPRREHFLARLQTIASGKQLDISDDDVAAVRWALDEIKRLNHWVEDCQSGMWINCVYCGHRYGPGNAHPASLAEGGPINMQEALKRHIEECPKHPMSRLKLEIEELRGIIKTLRQEQCDG